MSEDVDVDVDVVVSGAGLGGISTAMFLACRGIRVLLVERHAGTSILPKAAGQNPRTMELLRFGGIADKIVAAEDIRGTQGDFTIKIAETVGGKVLHTFAESFEELVGATEACTPMPWGMAAQDKVEPVLLEHARNNGAEVRFHTELVSFEQHADSVTVTLRDRDTECETSVRARYLVAADGPESMVRAKLGIARNGLGILAHFVGVIFEADLSSVLPAGSTGWYYLQNAAFTGTFGPTDRPDRHTFFVRYDPAAGQTPDEFTPQRCTELIRLAVNAPELTPVLLDIQAWEMAALIAERWRDGRVLLVGDAAKVTPPTGGLGGNTAIGDGFDVAWKLAAVLNGEAGSGLLDSYEPERRGIAELVVGESLSIYAERMAPELIGQVPEGRGTAEVVLGFRYRSDAMLDPDCGPDVVEDPLRPSGRPGFRAPHLWIDVDSERRSTIDLFGDCWTLLAGSRESGWAAGASPIAKEMSVRLRTYSVGADIVDVDGDFHRLYGISPLGASLIRPDGIIAWRSAAGPVDPDELRAALTHLLARS
ncbi:aklavinone 12-hydroxylase RdmE [Nocardia asteroides]